jgi:hypothetical protein
MLSGNLKISASQGAATTVAGMCHVDMPDFPLAAGPLRVLAWQHAGFGKGGRVVPALAQAARATCRLGKGAAIRRWSFLTKFF